MTREDRSKIGITEELLRIVRAMESDNAEAIDNADADFDNMIAWLDERQQGDGPDADIASLSIIYADTEYQRLMDLWAEPTPQQQ